MRYFAQYENNKLIAIGTASGNSTNGIEITEEEYYELLETIRTKASLVDKLYSGEITISDVPTEWQEEIQRRVDERIASEAELEDEPISSEEFYSMVEEVL
jgi:hypothetical protein